MTELSDEKKRARSERAPERERQPRAFSRGRGPVEVEWA
jgi:hypothetical protein